VHAHCAPFAPIARRDQSPADVSFFYYLRLTMFLNMCAAEHPPDRQASRSCSESCGRQQELESVVPRPHNVRSRHRWRPAGPAVRVPEQMPSLAPAIVYRRAWALGAAHLLDLGSDAATAAVRGRGHGHREGLRKEKPRGGQLRGSTRARALVSASVVR
jgi:hypothetical protein